MALWTMSGTDTNELMNDTAVAGTSVTMEAEDKQARPSLVELKNGKVVFKQKSISFEKQSETLQEIVQFRAMLEDRIKQQAPPLTAIPDEHRPLIVKLAHESDKTLPVLSKHIRQQLLPSQDDDEGEGSNVVAQTALPLATVETAIKSVMQRNNYGLDSPGGGKAPAAAKQDLAVIFESLTQDSRDAILDPKGTNKLPQKELNVIEGEPAPEDKATPQSKKKQKSKLDEENDSTKASASKPSRAPKTVDPAKAIKEQEKLDRKAAKAEKEKKEKDAQEKSRSIMANFFAKPKATTRTPVKTADSGIAGPSKISSEFEKVFKPFVLKKDAELAPINWFQENTKSKRKASMNVHDGVIIIDGDEDHLNVGTDNLSSPQIDVASMNSADHLRCIISSLSPSSLQQRRKPDPRLKTYNPLCVRDLVSKLSEAEIGGDDAAVRSILLQLNDRSLLPAKAFIFHEDGRPGYFGTWTRNSRIIGPRTPFAKDVLIFDYGYDSGEEWEEEPAGDADDVVDDGEDEEDGDEQDSDADSWLVDDDEDLEMPLDLDHDPLEIPDLPILPSKRKAEDGEKKIGKKRKVIIPLVPYAKGPCWESSLGQCQYSIFEPYKIQMFNDTPLSIDPFTFVSTCVEDSKRDAKVAPLNRPILLDDGVFVVPSLPDRLAQPNGSMPTTSATPPSNASTSTKKTLAPKQPFPEQYIPLLLDKITSLQATSINFLVEAIYRDLREQKIKKNMIEAKVREVGEKCKEKKFWIVKPSIQVPS